MKNNVLLWVWLCACLNCAGWFLSAIHQLNAIGYAVALVVGIAALFIWKNSWLPAAPSRSGSSRCWKKFLRRFKRPFPLAFLIISAMAFLGGALYAPTNYDALAYRVPRVLHWLDAGQWHWIHTIFPRVNASSCGIEWVSAPLMALFKSDRLLFLINFVSFLLLPGLIFSVLTRLSIRRRAAWHWMWLAPSGYCFLLQAGSLGNDAFGAIFALAAVDFALRAKVSRRPGDFFSSILAAALMTSVKFSNLPLLLPWAIAILPSFKILFQKPVATFLVCLVAAFASFLPKAVLNEYFCHDWSGVSLEYDQPHGSTALRTAGNIALVAILNLTPPVFSQADQWNGFVQKTLPASLKLRLLQTFTELPAAELQTTQMQIEENAGLGFGVIPLLFVSVIFAVRHRANTPCIHSRDTLWRSAVILSPWISTLVLLSRSEVYPIGRILAPNYLLLLPLLLAPAGHAPLVKKTWWRVSAFVVFAMAAGLLIISPPRPLFPVQTILGKIQPAHPDSKLLARVEEVYSVYHDRGHAFAPVLDLLPTGLKVLGLISYDDPEASLWQPFGSRRIIHVCPDDSAAFLKAEGVEYILAKDNMFGNKFPAFDDWLKTVNATVVQKIQLNLRASGGSRDWTLVKLN
jgi:hypothetical protein